uniref:Neural proliferation differentiation and control protein 1 n=1 Tax=Plectus sambesii TaxID=2011161 RepID=A0A914UNF5_9BILA
MAYKAQLHHYQQTKQKIISGEETGVTGARHESDDSGDDADDGDYSVYECPGLAPTGDIEVQNPMFDKNDTTTEGD